MRSASPLSLPDPEALPPLALIRQRFPATPPVDGAAELRTQLGPRLHSLRPGARVAVAVGSRGITGLSALVTATVQALQATGARPFILPAMGSHGGGTAAGQVKLLAEYGITETALGVPIHASMDVAPVGCTPAGWTVVCSVEALRADGVVLLNRIKPHTDFAGPVGSGLLKMLVVGLGKHAGAAAFHNASARHGYEPVLREAARVLTGRLPLLAGVAVVENQRHETARIEVVSPAALEEREAVLCAEARALMPQLPLAEVDLLVVDRMGKNVSGTGMDPAIIGRMIHGYSLAAEGERRVPHVHRLFVRDLTPQSHGNAIGLGMADFTTTRLVHAMDRRVTVTNALTALSLQGAKIPIAFDTDREAIAAALQTLPLTRLADARIVRITDTLSLEWLQVSAASLKGLQDHPGVQIQSPPAPMLFDTAGNLPPIAVPSGHQAGRMSR